MGRPRLPDGERIARKKVTAKAWRNKNKDRIRKNQAIYMAAKKEEINRNNRIRYATEKDFRERLLSNSKLWHKQNRGKYNEYHRDYRTKNKEDLEAIEKDYRDRTRRLCERTVEELICEARSSDYWDDIECIIHVKKIAIEIEKDHPELVEFLWNSIRIQKDDSITLQMRAYSKFVRKLVSKVKNVPCSDSNKKFHYSAMDFDHLDGSSKSFNICNSYGLDYFILMDEIKKCEVVCASCHRVRTFTRKTKDPEKVLTLESYK